jgi:DNA polymerase V
MQELKIYIRYSAKAITPLATKTSQAALENPNADPEIESIDLNAYLSNYPEATFFAKVAGDCMIGSGIYPDDLLVVDRSLTPDTGDIVVGIIDNEFVLRSYFTKSGKEYLMPDNNYFKPIERNEITPFEIWGVVPYTVIDQRRRNNARINRFEKLLR